jgi:hypothetical protein
VPESISADTEEVLHNIFEDLDQNHNGRLEPAELKVGVGHLIVGPCMPHQGTDGAGCDVEEDVLLHYTSPEQQAVHAWPIQEALRRLGLPARSKDYMADLLKQYDKDGDGRIDWGEFHAYVARKERVVKRTFRQLDADGNGSISPDELVRKGRYISCGRPCLFQPCVALASAQAGPS